VRRLIVLLMLLAVMAAVPAAAQVPDWDGTDRWLKLEWTAEEGKISGRIYNQYQSPADQVRLLIEALDATDQVVNQRYEWVGGTIPALGDRSFVVPVPPGGQHYRLAVASYTFRLFPGRAPHFHGHR